MYKWTGKTSIYIALELLTLPPKLHEMAISEIPDFKISPFSDMAPTAKSLKYALNRIQVCSNDS